MRHVGIICEYNPFHAGHGYLLSQVREAKTVICLMSGYFTQRGEAAVLPPAERAAMALAAGADLVLELPFPFAASSARYFATAGVTALQMLGADALAFGSESADLAALRCAATRTLEADFAKKVADGAKNRGDAAVYFDALGDDLPPNDILAVEYVRAALSLGDSLSLYPVRRVGAGYHDTALTQAYPSATALRKKMGEGGDVALDLMPETAEIWKTGVERWGVADTARLGPALLALLRTARAKSPQTGAENTIADCGGGLAERLMSAALEATDYASLCRAAATKKYTDGRIRRVLLYLLAGVTYGDLEAAPAYLRLLGANEKGREFLAKTRKTRTVPVVTKAADVAAIGESALRQRELSAVAEGLYALCLPGHVRPGDLSVVPPVLL